MSMTLRSECHLCGRIILLDWAGRLTGHSVNPTEFKSELCKGSGLTSPQTKILKDTKEYKQ